MVQVRTNEKRPNPYCSQLDRCYSLLLVHAALLYLHSSKGKQLSSIILIIDL